MVANPAKFQLMFLGLNGRNLTLRIDKSVIKSSNFVKLLGITIDEELKFKLHIYNICRLANFKVSCLYRIRKYLDEHHARRLCNALFCPILTIVHSYGCTATKLLMLR